MGTVLVHREKSIRCKCELLNWTVCMNMKSNISNKHLKMLYNKSTVYDEIFKIVYKSLSFCFSPVMDKYMVGNCKCVYDVVPSDQGPLALLV